MTYPIQRPPSEQLIDLHVYLLPRELWNEKYNSSYNESISEAQSAGFVRVWPELTVYELRAIIETELGHELLPNNYVFLRSVGRCLTRVKPKQEVELKCKSFLPPTAWAPEIVVLEASRDNVGSGVYQSFPDYSPRHDTTQPINGMPTHFPQLSNHDRTEPPEGQIPLVQHTHKEEPLGNMVGIPGKSGRPDAYTNNTNEDSGIAEPTPEEYDPDYDRRRSESDDQYYNHEGHPNRNRRRDMEDGTGDEAERYEEEERGIEEERQRQANILQQEEERRIEEEMQRQEDERREQIQKEEQRKEEKRKRDEVKKKEEQRKREEESIRENQRQLEQARKQAEEKKKEDARREQERKEDQRIEEARKEAERQEHEEMDRVFEVERQRKIAERIRSERQQGGMPYDDEDDADIAMETDLVTGNRRPIPTDAQMRRRAEDELRDYEPQSSWQREQLEDGGGRSSQFAPGARRSRGTEDAEMEMASQEAVRDGLKRVHLTPEIHRKAKIGKVQDPAYEEDLYETDEEMADLIQQLEAARQERLDKEKEREAMIKKAKTLQVKTYDRRYKSRDYWKKRYFDEKKRTTPLEDEVNRLKTQMEVMHRKLLSHLEGKKGKGGAKVKGPPSKKNDHKITILKMQHELDDIRRKVDNARMKLTSEVKLRNQAEAEVRSLKSEVTQRKINLTLTRNQKLAALKVGDRLLAKTPIPAVGQGPISLSAKR